ncbi:hypothetical protein OO184_15445 [Photorhabdus sp. APURE]|uniref:hypothetical protein n=1 Tax=Photorhabdus aballayi TaxID=2991723 RepID=UPI00223CC270|nr:hypothetical protein [Photorhabdus aballayi]MCW7549287.1 hypothetical protein [Photorhabdus aballayi]
MKTHLYLNFSMRLDMSLVMDIYFNCNCGEIIEEQIRVPYPDFSAEKLRYSQVESEEEVTCPYCERIHTINIINDFYQATATTDNGGKEVTCTTPYDEDDLLWYVDSQTHFSILQNNLSSVRSILNVDVPQDAKFNLLVMLHGHIISSVEGYLAGTFINKVTNSDSLSRKLIESDPELSKQTISLKKLFETQSNLKIIVADYLKNIIFHDMSKVRLMYKSVLGHEFGNIQWLFLDIKKRHDCAHRAGHTKDGERIDVTRDSILKTLENVEHLADSLENTLRQIKDSEASLKLEHSDF